MQITEQSPKTQSLPFTQIEALATQMLYDKKLTRDTNGFFRLSKAQKQISLAGAVKIAVNWRAITKDFLFTVLTGIGVFAEELRKVESPHYELIHVLQTEVKVISDDLMNVFSTLQEAAPIGPEGSHYIWWENTIANVIYAKAEAKGLKVLKSPSAKVQKLLDCMVMLSKHPFGAAVQLRVVEAIAQEICLSYRALFAEMQIDGVKLFPKMDDLVWVNAHIKAEVVHHRQVKDQDGGLSYIAGSFEEQQELLQLFEVYMDAWAGALTDFESFVREDAAKPVANVKRMGRKWLCVICDFIYDEAKGWPEEGIAPGTAFEDIPEDWVCPDCGVGKSDFVLMTENVLAIA